MLLMLDIPDSVAGHKGRLGSLFFCLGGDVEIGMTFLGLLEFLHGFPNLRLP